MQNAGTWDRREKQEPTSGASRLECSPNPIYIL